MWEKDPTRLLTEAVAGMLPKNKLRPYRMDKLKVFAGSDHPFVGFPLVPFVPKPRAINVPEVGWSVPQGMQPMNPERYNFRVRASPELWKLQQAAQAGTGSSSVQGAGSSSAAGKSSSAQGVDAASQGLAKMGLAGFEDMLTEEEKAALVKQAPAGQASPSGSQAARQAGSGKPQGGKA